MTPGTKTIPEASHSTTDNQTPAPAQQASPPQSQAEDHKQSSTQSPQVKAGEAEQTKAEAQQARLLAIKAKKKAKLKRWIERLKTFSIEEVKAEIAPLQKKIKDAAGIKLEYDRLSKEKGMPLRKWIKTQGGFPKNDPLIKLCNRVEKISKAQRGVSFFKKFLIDKERKLKKEQAEKEKQLQKEQAEKERQLQKEQAEKEQMAHKLMLEAQARLAGKPANAHHSHAGQSAPQVVYVQRKSKPLTPPPVVPK